MNKLIVLLMTMIFFSACTATTPKTAHDSGFLGDYSTKLEPGKKEGDPKLMWMRPGVDYRKYKRIMVDYVVFAFADDSEYKAIDANELKEIGDKATEIMIRTIKEDFPVVTEPAPDVLRVRVAITDLKQSRPALSAVTSVVPVGLAVSAVKRGTTDAWTGSGATTAEMMVLDSTTGEVLAAGQDTMSADFTGRFSKWGSVEKAFQFWADRFVNRLNSLVKA